MKVVILCGGRGTRLGEESLVRPKPMAAVGERPILWHIMKYYAHHGHKDFILCLGHLGEMIKDYFLHYEARQSDVTVAFGKEAEVTYHSRHDEHDWRVTLVDTGIDTMTGGRLKRVQRYVGNEPFLLTYGDGLGDVDLNKLVEDHQRHGKTATVTAVHPAARFGELEVEAGRVQAFSEKPQTSTGLINGGFFVFQPEMFDYLEDDESCVLEREPMHRLTEQGELMAFRHQGFWQCMDTVRELNLLRELWDRGDAPWKVW